MAKVVLPFQQASDADQNIYAYEGWRAYVEAPLLQRPPPPSTNLIAGMSSAEQAQYNEMRRQYIMRFGPINTPALDHVKRCVKEQLEANIRAARDQVKVGLVIDGHANLGKTTIAKVIGRQFERSIRAQALFPDDHSRDAFIPVVHVTLQRDTTPKALAQTICQYLHVPPHRSQTEYQLVQSIYQAVERHSILLFVIDDIHFLRIRSKSGQETSNFLKSLMSLTGATFIYVGVDVEEMGILQEHGAATLASSQTASRFIHLPIRPLEKTGPDWPQLLRTIESHLPLNEHQAGTLERCADLLYNRTGGSMGSLMNLLRKAALQAVGHHERLDGRTLQRVALDYRATVEGNLDGTTK